MRETILKALATLILSALPAAAPAQVEFKTLTIVVGSTSGGGYDVYARALARHIGRHVPGRPTVIVQNMPGAASLKSVQYLDTGAPKDGSVITAFNAGVITESLINADRIQFKFSDVGWIGSITRDLRACYSWAATGIRTFEELRRAKRFNMGAPAAGTSSFIDAAVLKNMFGIAVHHVMGYSGSGEARIAIERGELDGDCGAWSSVPPDWVSRNKVNPLVSFSSIAVPGLPSNVPFLRDRAGTEADKLVFDMVTMADLLGRPFVVSRQVPPERLGVLRRAFDATLADAQFVAEIGRMDLPLAGPIMGVEAEKMIAAFYSTPPPVVARAREIVGR